MAGFAPGMRMIEQQLFNGAHRADVSCVISALEAGAKSSILDAEQCTAIHALALSHYSNGNLADRIEILNHLTERGVDIDALNKSHLSALSLAALNRSMINVQALLSFSPQLSGTLHKICEVSENLPILRVLIEAGADPMECNLEGLRPLEVAKKAWKEDASMISFLEAAELKSEIFISAPSIVRVRPKL